MSPTTWLITGASRGIGFEFVRQTLASPDNLVVATCRNPDKANALNDLKSYAKGTLHIVPMDVADFNSVHAAKKYLDSILGETGLDFLINNAGIAVQDTAFTLDPEEFINVIRTNVVGPALVTQICLPLLEKGSRKTVLNISSTAGSLQSVAHTVGTPASYSISKAALNMLTLKQKVDRPDFIAITLCPGWVKTDMGGKNARLEPEESIRSILKIVTSATTDDSGKYLRYNGEVIPW